MNEASNLEPETVIRALVRSDLCELGKSKGKCKGKGKRQARATKEQRKQQREMNLQTKNWKVDYAALAFKNATDAPIVVPQQQKPPTRRFTSSTLQHRKQFLSKNWTSPNPAGGIQRDTTKGGKGKDKGSGKGKSWETKGKGKGKSKSRKGKPDDSSGKAGGKSRRC